MSAGGIALRLLPHIRPYRARDPVHRCVAGAKGHGARRDSRRNAPAYSLSRITLSRVTLHRKKDARCRPVIRRIDSAPQNAVASRLPAVISISFAPDIVYWIVLGVGLGCGRRE